MSTTMHLLDEGQPSFLEAQENPDLNREILQAHDHLANQMDAMTASGLLLDVAELRRLRTCTARALSVAIAYRRRVGPCGYRCRLPGLHCPDDDELAVLVASLEAGGWRVHDDPNIRAAAAVTCVCGEQMQARALRRGRQSKAWGACSSCGHWVAL